MIRRVLAAYIGIAALSIAVSNILSALRYPAP